MVARLWPHPPSELDLSTHPVLDSSTRLSQVFLDSGLSHGLGAGQRSVGNGSPWEEWCIEENWNEPDQLPSGWRWPPQI
ncbi:hypothetical protein [Nocardia sp. NPDC003979]